MPRKTKKQNKPCHLNFSDCVNEVICLIEVVSINTAASFGQSAHSGSERQM